MVVLRTLTSVLTIFLATGAGNAQNFKMPPEVTPALRAACENDVRRLCIADGATVLTVKGCVTRRFAELSTRCKVQIAAAGLTPGGR